MLPRHRRSSESGDRNVGNRGMLEENRFMRLPASVLAQARTRRPR